MEDLELGAFVGRANVLPGSSVASGNRSSSPKSSSNPLKDDREDAFKPDTNYDWITANNASLIYVRKIDNGAHSAVHEIKNINTGTRVARKVVHLNGRISIQDVMNEQKAVIKLCHSNADGNVIRVFDHGWLEHEQYFYFDMELCDFSLFDYIHRNWSPDTAVKVPNFANIDTLGPLANISQIYNIMIEISNGIAFIHGSGYIHRDLTPKNVLYDCNQKKWKVADFGLSAEGATDNGPYTENARGTGVYRAPEMVNGDKTKILNRCDIWAMGVIFYELVHQKLPFKNEFAVRDYAASYRPEDDPFPLAVNLPEGLENEVLKRSISELLPSMLNPQASKRPSARELVRLFQMTLTELLSDVVGSPSLDQGWNQRSTLPVPATSQESASPNGSIGAPVNSRLPLLRGYGGNIGYILGRPFGSRGPSIEAEVPEDSPLKALEKTLEIRKRVLGTSHPKTLKSMRTLASQYASLGYHQKSIGMYEERVRAGSDVYGPEDPRLLIIKNDLALSYSRVKNFAAAAKIGEEINEILPLAFSPEDTNFLTLRYNLGYFYEFQGELSKSAAIYEEVLRVYKTSRGRDTRSLNLVLTGLESVYTRLGRYNDALRVCKDILELQQVSGGEESPQALWTMKVIAQHYQSLRRTKDAVATYERIFLIRQRTRGPEHQSTLNSLSDLARAYIDDGQKEEAKKRLEEVLEVMERIRGQEHPDTLDLMDTIAMISLGGEIPKEDGNDDLDDVLQDLVDNMGIL